MARLSPLLAAAALGVSAKRIDTHHHAIPQVYRDALEKLGGDSSGFTAPQWSLDDTLKSMDSIGTDHAILSVTAPGPALVGDGKEGRQLAREINCYFGNITTEGRGHDRLGFFGALPDFNDVEGTIAEIDFLYKEQKLAHGVAIVSDYQGKLPGDPDFSKIWEALNSYEALVFLHPSTIPGVQPEFIAGGLSAPIVDFPLATTRAGVDLVLTGRMAASPKVDVILSHAGGTIPYVGPRLISSLSIPEVAETVSVTKIQAEKDFARFYHDTALSSSDSQLHGLLDFTDPGQVLFGSDFPYAPGVGVVVLTKQYDHFVKEDPRGDAISQEVLHKNAASLLSKHEQGNKFWG